MKPTMTALPTLTQSAAYRIRFAGRARNGWSDFLTGLREAVSKIDGHPVTELIGVVSDQPALFGLLCHIRDLGLPLVSVEYLPDHKKENL
ncbi:MAG TPA: hypothetical protein VK206_18595 [Anaerolineales bacterium]|nr:hypothetical protein [Anaerolineales bacterium]